MAAVRDRKPGSESRPTTDAVHSYARPDDEVRAARPRSVEDELVARYGPMSRWDARTWEELFHRCAEHPY